MYNFGDSVNIRVINNVELKMKKPFLGCLFILILSSAPIFGSSSSVLEITAEGMGINERSAVEDAFRNAIEKSIGVYVDSETQIENNNLIKDNILTASKGYIEKYRVLSLNNQDGVTKITIKAIVKMQDVRNKLSSMNISTLNAGNSKNTYARLTSKNKWREDAEKILKKEFADILSTKSILQLLDIKLLEYRVKENEVTRDNMVPLILKFKISVNLDNYNEKIKNLSAVFDNLGASVSNKFNLSIVDSKIGCNFRQAQIAGQRFENFKAELKRNYKYRYYPHFGLVAHDESGYTLIHYRFPLEWREIYPWASVGGIFNRGSRIRMLNDIMVLSTLRGGNSILFEIPISFSEINNRHLDSLILLHSFDLYGALDCEWKPDFITGFNIAPFFLVNGICPSGVISYSFSLPFQYWIFIYETKIKMDLLYDLQSIELSFVEK